MTIEQQRRLALRVETDFRKESKQHRRDGNELAAVDCETLADGMAAIRETLKSADALRSALAAFQPNP